MKKLILLILPLLIALSGIASPTYLIRSEHIDDCKGHLTRFCIRTCAQAPRADPLRRGSFTRWTTTRWSDGSSVMASGLIFCRMPLEAIPLVAYGHGTRLQKERLWNMKGEESICAFFAADGYAVAMPDYLGLGRGERNHLYHHANTEATC
ncbi:MAG: hypothetical protein IPP17_25555 [Bacteroidetes bacterium]|nr:hypothetical protein [Bacteroidota bacterium]